MGRPELFFSLEALPETRAQKTQERPNSSSLILVSTSQVKEDCLRLSLNSSGVKVETVNAGIAERDWQEIFLRTGLGQYSHFPVVPQAIAYAKAYAVVESNRQARVIATDVITLTDNEKVLGKPMSLEEAITMVTNQNGRTLTQIAGTVYWDGHEWTFGQTKVKMKRCYRDEEEIERYLQADPPMILSAAGGLPITDQEALETFYEKGVFSVSSFCFNQRGEKNEVSSEKDSVSSDNHLLLIQTVNGLSPNLLRSMKIV